MIVPLEALRRIQEGRQSVLLRSGPTCFYNVGRPYKVKSKREHEAKLSITITEKRQIEARSLDLRMARRLGYRTTAELFGSIPRLDPSEQIWLLSFEIGDVSDTPRLLARRPGPGHDYVSTASQALNGSAEEVSEHDHRRYAANSELGRTKTLGEQRKRLQSVLAEIREHAHDPEVNKKLRDAQRRVRLTTNLDRVF